MVNFVGAGPGAEDLITLRGQRLLSEADVIIYAGSLVNEGLLKYKKSGCAVYNSAYMTLEEVIDVILDAEKNGLNTVRPVSYTHLLFITIQISLFIFTFIIT